MIKVAVCGAAGRMGREVVAAIAAADGMEVVAAIDHHQIGEDAGTVAGISALSVLIENDLEAAIGRTLPQVLVDFTLPASVMANVELAIAFGISPVIGTTGLSRENLHKLDKQARMKEIGAFVAPNFAIGAVLMMQFAAQAAKYLPDVEIIELHHEKKLDSPSGTALLIAQKIAHARTEAGASPRPLPTEGLIEKAAHARGAREDVTGDVPIHSVRLPGFVAHQEVIFGGTDEVLTLRHDSMHRRSFMPGVVLAVRKVRQLNGLVIGLENLL